MNDLQAKYIDHFINRESEMDPEDASRFLGQLMDDINAPFRDERMAKLARYIADRDKRERGLTENQRRQLAAAIEYRDLTDKWLRLGATWRVKEKTLTIWEYEGERFYRWWSGTLILDNIIEARKADALLMEIIAKEAAQ